VAIALAERHCVIANTLRARVKVVATVRCAQLCAG
jgi:hypothetical protein